MTQVKNYGQEQGKIWLIGGTTESRLIAQAIEQSGLSTIVTVATPTAKNLYPAEVKVRVGGMDLQTMQKFCLTEKIFALIDASHPYAVEVSQNAIATAKANNIPYLRYERPPFRKMGKGASAFEETWKDASAPRGNGEMGRINNTVINLASFEDLLTGNYLPGKKVLLTIGCKNLHLFKSWQEKATLFARILPKPESLAMAISAGFTTERIIAIRPPIGKELEQALWQQWQISLVVTKASGKAGGEDIKREIASKLGIPLIVIARPQIIYPQKTTCLDEAIAFCHKHLSG